MTDGSTSTGEPVMVSREIGAPADRIFAVLADPGRHEDLDGSGMLRGATTAGAVTGLGDVFTMRMYFDGMGDYEMDNVIVAFEEGRRIGWAPRMPGIELAAGDPGGNGSRWIFELEPRGPDATLVTEIYDCSASPAEVRATVADGTAWTGAMEATLERLEAACTG